MRATAGILLVLALAFILRAPVSAGEPAPESRKGDSEVRLSEGEVLEMASGEIEKAMAIYRDVLAGEGIPGPTRARALYLLARCERKLGKLGDAERLLEEIVEKHARIEPFRSRAEGLLKEMRGGRRTPPDWLAALRENESVQSQIFQLALDLASPVSDEGKAAARKLRAMGSLAQPILRTVMQTTADPIHRRTIALLLARTGDFGELDAALDPLGDARGLALSSDFTHLIEAIPAFGEHDRVRFLAALEKLPEGRLDPGYRAVLELAAARTEDIGRCLDEIEKVVIRDPGEAAEYVPDLVERVAARHLGRDRATSSVIIGRMLTGDLRMRPAYFRALDRTARAALTAEVILEAGEVCWPSGIPILRARKDYTALTTLVGKFEEVEYRLEGGLRSLLRLRMDELLRWMEALALQDEDASLGALIGAVLLARHSTAGPRTSLIPRFFLHHDEALGDLESVVRRAAAVPDFRLHYKGPDSRELPPPSARFLALFRRLAVDPDPKVRIHAISQWIPHLLPFDPALVDALARHLTDPAISLPETASLARIKLFEAASIHPDRAGDGGRALASDFARNADAYGEVLGARRRIVGWGHLAVLNALIGDLASEDRARLGHYLVGLLSVERRISPRATTVRTPPGSPTVAISEEEFGRFAAACKAAIEKDGKGPKRERLALVLSGCRKEVADREPIAGFLDEVVADPSIAYDIRLEALSLRSRETPVAVLKEFLARKDEATKNVLLLAGRPRSWARGRSRDDWRAILQVLLEHPDPKPREIAVRTMSQYFGADRQLRIAGNALADPEVSVRDAAVGVLTALNDHRIVPLLGKAIGDEEESIRARAVSRLGQVAGDEAMEALVRALDDRSPRIRKAALEALREIKQQMEERDQWKRWLRDRGREGGEAPREER